MISDRVKVYDGVFSHNYRSTLFNLAQESLFRVGWVDDASPEWRGEMFLHSYANKEAILQSGILKEIKDNSPEIDKWLGTRFPQYSILNCDTHADVHNAHSHLNMDVILIYLNQDWKLEWYGETLFYSEDLSEIIFAGLYTPGRIICFDGEVPHSIRPNSRLAPKFRYTMSLFFKKEK